MVRFVYDTLAGAVDAFEKDAYHRETATFLIQLISVHPSAGDERFQALIERLKNHPQDPSGLILLDNDCIPTQEEVLDAAKNFWKGTYREDVADFLEQMRSSHPARDTKRFRHVGFVLDRHPQKSGLKPLQRNRKGIPKLASLAKLVKGFENSHCDETVAHALIELIGSHPGAASRNHRDLMKRVAENPRGPGMPASVLTPLSGAHYFDMTARVASVEQARDVSAARELLETIHERIPADDRYEHLALRVQYVIDAHAKKPAPQKTVQQREQERRLAGWRQTAPRGLGVESTQRLTGGWRTVSGGLPDK